MVMEYIDFVLLISFPFLSLFTSMVENKQCIVSFIFKFFFLFRTQQVLTPPFSDLVWLENGLVVKRMMQTLWLLRCCSHQYQEIKMSSGTARIAAVLEEGWFLIWPRNFIFCETELSLLQKFHFREQSAGLLNSHAIVWAHAE